MQIYKQKHEVYSEWKDGVLDFRKYTPCSKLILFVLHEYIENQHMLYVVFLPQRNLTQNTWEIAVWMHILLALACTCQNLLFVYTFGYASFIHSLIHIFVYLFLTD